MTRHYLIPGQPVSLPRQRFNRHTGRSYKPTPYLKRAQADRCILIEFFSSRPKRLLRKADPAEDLPRPVRPDIDNLCKHVLDVCNGILYVDDARVTYLSASDRYCAKGVQPHTTITMKGT
jgi:Holliday junction resolvase RusA-like endonuclease